MIFDNRTGSTRLSVISSRAIDVAREVLRNPSLMPEKFAYTDESKETIVRTLSLFLENQVAFKIFYYRPWNPFTSAIGYTSGKNVYLRKGFFLNDSELCGFFVHEALGHGAGYKHPFWRTPTRIMSVPYAIGLLASKRYSGMFAQ